MVFSSLLFLFRFLPVVLVLYFLVPKQLRNLLLFLSSLVFYAWGEPVYVVLMLFSTIVDFTHGKLVHHFKEQGNNKMAKLFVISAVVVNLGLLGFFKYTDFLIGLINQIFGVHVGLLNLPLPIGISFYTFQTMSYTIDVYRGEAKVQNNIISFGAYVAMFPQLIAGPIVRYQTVAAQLDARTESADSFAYGISRFMTGLGKKVLLANNIGLVWKEINSMPVSELSTVLAWFGILAFAFQIYFDFSGYSDMAIGLGAIFGFHFLENFHYPYMAVSITDFWRRWHISLGTWFKEYVYIPLGGNQHGRFRQIRNIAIVWALTGFWHGAHLNFLMWGIYFGALLILEKVFLLRYLNRLPKVIGWLYTMLLVLAGWALFAYPDMQQGSAYLKVLANLGGAGFFTGETLYYLASNGILLVLLILGSTNLPLKMVRYMQAKIGETSVRVIIGQNLFYIVVFVLSTAYLVDATYNPFLYFRF